MLKIAYFICEIYQCHRICAIYYLYQLKNSGYPRKNSDSCITPFSTQGNKWRESMSLMTVAEVAEFLGVQEIRVERLEREHLLNAKEKDAAGAPLFDKTAVEKYKELAARLGGI